MKCFIAPLALSLAATPLAATELEYRLIDHLVTTETTHPDLELGEVSGLAWDAEAQMLLAVSDRNDLYHLSLGDDLEQLKLDLVSRNRLTDEAGERLRGRHFNAEGLSLAEPGSGLIAILSETPPELATFDRDARRVQTLPLPPELQDTELLRSKGNGLESLAWHPTLGYLFAPEAPLDGEPRRTHVLYNSEGAALAFHTGNAGTTSIKGMETLPEGRLVILERDRLDDTTIQPFLRVIDPAACPISNPCSTPAIPLELPEPHDADFEGITWLGKNRVLLASDDRVEKTARTVFAVIELELDN